MSKKKKKALSDFKRKRKEFKKLMKFVLKNNTPSFERPEYKAGDILTAPEEPVDTETFAKMLFVFLEAVYGERSNDYLRFFHAAIAYSLRDLDLDIMTEIRVGEINTLVADISLVKGGKRVYQVTVAANGNINVASRYKEARSEYFSYKVK